MIICKTSVICEEEISLRVNENQHIQPFIMVVGTILEPKEFLVYLDGHKYQINAFLNAIDVCFKIFNLFNLEYPIESVSVWSFIQKYFYKIKTKTDQQFVTVNCLIESLKAK